SASDAALHFVGDEQNAVAIADAAQLLHEHWRRRNIPTLALHRLDEDCGNFFRGHGGFENLVFEEARTGQRVVFSLAIDIRIRNMGHARNERSKTAALPRLGGGKL